MGDEDRLGRNNRTHLYFYFSSGPIDQRNFPPAMRHKQIRFYVETGSNARFKVDALGIGSLRHSHNITQGDETHFV